VIVASIVISVILLLPKKEEEFKIEGIDLPNNMEVLKDTVVGDLKITDVSLLTREGTSTFKASVLNETDKDIKVNTLTVVFYNGKSEIKVKALVNVTILANDDGYINIQSQIDLSNVDKIEYVLE
jgi:hypothetical protein